MVRIKTQNVVHRPTPPVYEVKLTMPDMRDDHGSSWGEVHEYLYLTEESGDLIKKCLPIYGADITIESTTCGEGIAKNFTQVAFLKWIILKKSVNTDGDKIDVSVEDEYFNDDGSGGGDGGGDGDGGG